MRHATVEMRRLVDGVPVIPVLVIEKLADAVPMAVALVEGGMRVLEVTLRSRAALPAIEAMVRASPGATVGAGTILNGDDAAKARAAGAAFAVSPGYTPELGVACAELGLPLLPGAATATEVMAALDDGHDFLKFFPAEAAGGIAMLKSLAGPFPQVAFCPTGGISPANLEHYLSLPNVTCVGGSWLTPSDLVRRGDWAGVTALCRSASSAAGRLR
jgi:2-dehydro-3-deoxyphosphogluconate aldolase/(4S)-4-hydroxy-2-oxoglutarate aldolase